MLRLTLRVDADGTKWIGPGKIRLLELIETHGSISKAGRAMDMSYRRAWLLVEAISLSVGEPVVRAQPGGVGGGGAKVTPAGRRLVEAYRDMERAATEAAAGPLAVLQAMRADRPG